MQVTLSDEQIDALRAALGAAAAVPDVETRTEAINTAWVAATLPLPPPC